MILVLSVLFILFLVVYYLTSKVNRLDSIPIGIESIILFIYIFSYFYNLLAKFDPNFSLFEKSSFWFIVGIFFYLGTTFFFNILGNSMDRELIASYYHYSYFGDILKNILFSVGVILLPKNLKSNNSQNSNIPLLDII